MQKNLQMDLTNNFKYIEYFISKVVGIQQNSMQFGKFTLKHNNIFNIAKCCYM